MVPVGTSTINKYLTDADSTTNVIPTIAAKYQSVCKFSISITPTRSPLPNTSSTVILFTAILNALIVNVNTALITLKSFTYDLTLPGVYSIPVKYLYGGTGADYI